MQYKNLFPEWFMLIENIKIKGCRMEADTQLKHFAKLSVTASAQICGGVVVPIFIGINSQPGLKLNSEQNDDSPFPIFPL